MVDAEEKTNEEKTKIVFFVDALGEEFFGKANFLSDLYSNQGGKVISDATNTRVTPSVLGGIYTGVSASQHGLLAPTGNKFDEPLTRPDTHTIMKQLDDMGYSVLSYDMPFTLPLDFSDNSSARCSGMQNAQIMPGDKLEGAELQMPVDRSNIREAMIKDQENEILSRYTDNVSTTINAVRTWLSADLFDVMFISIRWIDPLVHYCPNYAIHEDLANIVSVELSYLYDEYSEMADIFVFSDHGGQPAKSKFELNRWLMDNDYLSVSLNLDKYDYWYDDADDREDGGPAENQININDSTFRTIDEENSVCATFDAFGSCIDLLGEYENDKVKAKEVAAELSKLSHFKAVHTKWDFFNEDAKNFLFLPEIIPDRADGVLVSGNLHPDPIGEVHYRTGAHTRRGIWLSTMSDVDHVGTELLPQDLYTVIMSDFIGVSDLTDYITRQAQQASAIPAHLRESFCSHLLSGDWKIEPADEKTDEEKEIKSEVAERLQHLGYV